MTRIYKELHTDHACLGAELSRTQYLTDRALQVSSFAEPKISWRPSTHS